MELSRLGGRVAYFIVIGPANWTTMKVQLFLGHERRILGSCATVKRGYVDVGSVCLYRGFNKMVEMPMQQIFCEECFHSTAGSRGGDDVHFRLWLSSLAVISKAKYSFLSLEPLRN
jgi:hypothetical protein